MVTFNIRCFLLFLTLYIAAVPLARAQWAVIDAPAIVQLVKEVQALTQQVATAKAQLLEAQQTLQAITGNRGMDQLLSGTPRNYLPADWTQLNTVLTGVGGAYTALSADVQSAMLAAAVLSPQRLSTLAPAQQQQILAMRQLSAMRQALSREALANASGRFAAIQNLIAAIPTARDEKAILDLQARIAAEVGMLQNEQTKLQVLERASLAQESSYQSQEREQIIAAHGRFQDRLQPTP